MAKIRTDIVATISKTTLDGVTTYKRHYKGVLVDLADYAPVTTFFYYINSTPVTELTLLEFYRNGAHVHTQEL